MKYFTSAFLVAALVFAALPSFVNAESSNADSYIVVFTGEVVSSDAVSVELAAKHGFQLDHAYSHALRGFSGHMSKGQLAKLERDPRVAFVAPDRLVQAVGKPATPVESQGQVTPTGISRIGANLNSNTGAGVTVAVIDTGIQLNHPDLSGAILAGKNCTTNRKNASASDDNGHGTHVAGTIGGRNNTVGVVGVSPAVNFVAVKVLNSQGSGTWSSVICGIDWVTANASRYNIKVANMSLGGSGSSDNNCGLTNNDALHKAICNSRNAGVTYVVAAGNNGTNASTFSPANYDDAVITVSALADSDGIAGGFGSGTAYGVDDTFASFSNYGSVVDLGAPGVNIYSTWIGSGYATASGTSMAAPHVAGAAALYIKSHPGSTWTQVLAGLKAAGEALNSGHTDPSGLHPEVVLKANAL